MPHSLTEPGREAHLRSRAAQRLTGGAPSALPRATATDALAVLHALALSPRTATDALALLHELQVHQVELELQADELQASRIALEASLRQQAERYDALPVACIDMDARLVLHEMNQAAARMLGVNLADADGRSVESCLAPGGAGALRQMVAALAAGAPQARATVPLRAQDGPPPWASATLGADATGQGYLLVLPAADDGLQPHTESP